MYYCGLQKFINTCIEKGALFPFSASFPQIYNHHSCQLEAKSTECTFVIINVCFLQFVINHATSTHSKHCSWHYWYYIWMKKWFDSEHWQPTKLLLDTTQPKTRVSRYFPEMLTILPDWQNSLSRTLLLINSSVWKAHPVGRIHKADNELSRCLGLKALRYLIACFECSILMF